MTLFCRHDNGLRKGENSRRKLPYSIQRFIASPASISRVRRLNLFRVHINAFLTHLRCLPRQHRQPRQQIEASVSMNCFCFPMSDLHAKIPEEVGGESFFFSSPRPAHDRDGSGGITSDTALPLPSVYCFMGADDCFPAEGFPGNS